MERLLGIAMGCMGMGMDDFCRCAPSEFYEAYEAWRERERRRERAAWERMRMQCLCSLQPYSRSRLRAEDVMRFPWDGEDTGREKESEKACGPSKQVEMSREEIMERYRKARERAGL